MFCPRMRRLQLWKLVIPENIYNLKNGGMGNAKAHVKRAADEVTLSCDEDGVAVFLELIKPVWDL